MIPYWEMEEYLLGMYDKVHFRLEDYLIEKSIFFLSDCDLFFKVGLNVLSVYKKSSDFHLKNESINKQAWIGQASCFYNHGCPEYLTRKSWIFLSKNEQIKANLVADRLIKIYEGQNKKIHSQMEIFLP